MSIGKTRPPFLREKIERNRDIQEAGSRSSSYNTGVKYPARSQSSRYNQEQVNPKLDYYRRHKQRNRYIETTPSTTPKSTYSQEEEDEIYFYNTELPGKRNRSCEMFGKFNIFIYDLKIFQ